jgi:hypothetical protein
MCTPVQNKTCITVIVVALAAGVHPQVIRALVRWYAVVILPAFLSYYWAGVAANLGNALGAIMMVLVSE